MVPLLSIRKSESNAYVVWNPKYVLLPPLSCGQEPTLSRKDKTIANQTKTGNAKTNILGSIFETRGRAHYYDIS